MAALGGGPCPSGPASRVIWLPGTEASLPSQAPLVEPRGLCGREDEASAGHAPSTTPHPLHTPLTSKSAMFFPSYSFPFSRSVLLMNGLLSLGFPSPGGKERRAETAVLTADQATPASFHQPAALQAPSLEATRKVRPEWRMGLFARTHHLPRS